MPKEPNTLCSIAGIIRLLRLTPFALAFALTQITNAQTNTFPNSGSVGIGTLSPAYPLDVVGSTRASGYSYSSSKNSQTYTLTNGPGWYRIASVPYYLVAARVRINGLSGSNVATDITFFVSTMAYQQASSIQVVNNGYYNSNHIVSIRTGTDPNNIGYCVVDVQLQLISNPTPMSVEVDGYLPLITPIFNPDTPTAGSITVPGNSMGGGSTVWNTYLGYGSTLVGIGTVHPDQKLTVNGTIHASEVLVDNNVIPDFVFADNYRLAPLPEVEAAIRRDHHLPGIPSAPTIAAKGLPVGQMQAKLLQQIEELTLHAIDQEKRLSAQAEELNNQSVELAAMRKQVNALLPGKSINNGDLQK